LHCALSIAFPMNPERTSILFVDDDPNILSGLRRRLRSLPTWDSVFVNSAAEAIAALSGQSFDAIATDLHMPGMNGAALLTEVKRQWPATFRIVLSGTCASAAVLSTVRDAHHFLSKPFDVETLKDVLDRALRSRREIRDPALAAFASGVTDLPSLPVIYQRITEALADDSLSVREIGDLISEDVAMSGKILRLINSGFFGLPRRITTPGEAAIVLGLEVVRSLVLGSALYASIDPKLAEAGGLEELWRHSLQVAQATRVIAGLLPCGKAMADAAHQAAILHEIGRLVFLMNKPDEYQRYRRELTAPGVASLQAEVRHLGFTHEALGSFVLATWGLPDAVVHAVSSHRKPVPTPDKAVDAVCLLHLADNLSQGSLEHAPGLDSRYVDEMGLSGSITAFADAAAAIRPQPERKPM
jgi:HD-like signal output (HDOD) protein